MRMTSESQQKHSNDIKHGRKETGTYGRVGTLPGPFNGANTEFDVTNSSSSVPLSLSATNSARLRLFAGFAFIFEAPGAARPRLAVAAPIPVL